MLSVERLTSELKSVVKSLFTLLLFQAMQPGNREMQGLNSVNSCLNPSQVSLQDLQNGHHHQHQQQIQNPQIHHQVSDDDFLEQMLSNLPSCSWPDLSSTNPKSPWLLNPSSISSLNENNNHKLFNIPTGDSSKSSDLSLMLQQQMLLSRTVAGAGGLRSHSAAGVGDSGFLPLPLSLGSGDSCDSHLQNDVVDATSFKTVHVAGDGSVQGLYNGFAGSLHANSQSANQQNFHHTQGGPIQAGQNFGGPASAVNQAPANGSAGGSPSQPRQRVRARRGQATDPHSIAERLRRERIAERMRALQELVPNANKTDKASMLDEIIDYVKFLQLQVKVLSMSRLGGAAAVAPLVTDISSEGGGDCIQVSGVGRSSNGTQTASSNDNLKVTEHQVSKLMEEDMGSAMQYLQGKGLCLMPISLATAISTATCHSRNPMINNPLLASNGDGPSSPSMSVLTVQSATMANGGADASVKDAASVSKP